jgi:large subunit ribosomal protein L18
MKEKVIKLNTIDRKRFRIRNKAKKVSSSDRLRLSISRSTNNISAQIIDDVKNITLLSCSSVEKDIKAMNKVNKTELSKIVAEKLAKKALEKKITKIYFDRGVYKYHGRVKIFAETLRKNGMEF